MAMAAMNRINISLIFLIMISMVLPTSAIMYASGSTDNSDALDSEFSENRFASDSGSLTIVTRWIASLPRITVTHHRLTSFPITPTHHNLVSLLMIMLIYLQRLWKIISLYPVNLR